MLGFNAEGNENTDIGAACEQTFTVDLDLICHSMTL